MATKEIRISGTLFARRDGGQAADPEFSLRGTALSYNTLSSDLGGFKERIMPGAFAQHLRTNPDVTCLKNHDHDQILGRTRSGTLALSDGPKGLDFVCKLDKNQQAHRDLYSSVKRGDLAQCSFAFSVDGDDGDSMDETTGDDGKRFFRRTVKRAKIFDVSVVTSPAYPGAATSVAARARTIVPSVAATLAAEDAWLRRQAAIVGEQIRVDAILDPSLGAVVFRDGKWHRDFEAESRMAARDDDDDYDDDPGYTDDDEDFNFDFADDDAPKKHKKKAEKHRTLAHRTFDMFASLPHFRAADLHDVAARTRSAAATEAALAASRALRKRK